MSRVPHLLTRRTGAQPELERAPDLPRRIRIPIGQGLGMLIFMCLPLAALAGLFGKSEREYEARNAELELHVRAPTRLYFHDSTHLLILIRNASPKTLERVIVRVSAPYAEGFSAVHFVPAPDRAYEFALSGLAPGETRRIATALQGDRYGVIAGRIEAETAASHLDVALRTFVFP